MEKFNSRKLTKEKHNVKMKILQSSIRVRIKEIIKSLGATEPFHCVLHEVSHLSQTNGCFKDGGLLGHGRCSDFISFTDDQPASRPSQTIARTARVL